MQVFNFFLQSQIFILECIYANYKFFYICFCVTSKTCFNKACLHLFNEKTEQYFSTSSTFSGFSNKSINNPAICSATPDFSKKALKVSGTGLATYIQVSIFERSDLYLWFHCKKTLLKFKLKFYMRGVSFLSV